jgi:hypothetical protein
MSSHDEQRVRTMAGWIGVEISKSRVRTPGKAGYGLYRVRAAAERHWHVPHPKVEADGPWTAYAYTLGNIRWSVRAAIAEGTPAGPGPLRLLSGPEQLDRPIVSVPTRWTSAYRGRRDLGEFALSRGENGPVCANGGKAWPFHAGPVTDMRQEPTMGQLAQRMVDRGFPVVPMPGLQGVVRMASEREAEDVQAEKLEPVAVRPEYAAEVTALDALVGAGLVEMTHVEGCLCDDDRYTAACIRASMTPRQRQKTDNAVFHAEHMERRAYGLEARKAAKLSRNAMSRDQRRNEGGAP